MQRSMSSADVANKVPPTQSPNMTLRDIMMKDSLRGDVIHQVVLRRLIKRLAQLEKESIFYGELDASQISIYQGSKVTILNEPKENDFDKPKFKDQIEPLITKAFEVQALSGNLEFNDFVTQIRNAEIRFGKLESHPFLKSYEEKANFLLEAVNKLMNKHENWQSVYNDEVKDYTSIRQVVSACGKKGYLNVLDNQAYEDNAAGALWYSRNVVAHIGDHFKQDETKPTIEEVVKMLSNFFPKMMLGLYKFIVENEIDTGSESEPRQIDLKPYIT